MGSQSKAVLSKRQLTQVCGVSKAPDGPLWCLRNKGQIQQLCPESSLTDLIWEGDCYSFQILNL